MVKKLLGKLLSSSKRRPIEMLTVNPADRSTKAKFDVYPSAYANMYASAVCSGKVVPGGRKKKMGGGSVSQQRKMVSNYKQGGVAKGCGGVMENRRKVTKKY